jgi:hypothetical protein
MIKGVHISVEGLKEILSIQGAMNGGYLKNSKMFFQVLL